jgi:hypothetical protein
MISIQIRRRVMERAAYCCEYCRLSQEDMFFAFEIDHIISRKHGGSDDLDNLCLSCPDCNAYKGSDIASIDRVSGQVALLFNPRQQIWSEHFQLNGSVVEPISP